MTEPSSEVLDQITFSEMIRTADERGLLLNGWEMWSNYRRARGTTSHTYDEKEANEILLMIPGFLEEAEYLLRKLYERQSET